MQKECEPARLEGLRCFLAGFPDDTTLALEVNGEICDLVLASYHGRSDMIVLSGYTDRLVRKDTR